MVPQVDSLFRSFTNARSPISDAAPGYLMPVDVAAEAERVVRTWHSLFHLSNWYEYIHADLMRYILRRDPADSNRTIRWAIYDCVADALDRDAIALGDTRARTDANRGDVRYIVVHHSGTLPSVSLSRLSAMGLLRLYVPSSIRRLRATRRADPVASSHFHRGKQVFYPYHWIIRPNGDTDQLLPDSAIGWHSGDWTVNRTSIGVCLAGDYTTTTPHLPALEALYRIAGQYEGAQVVTHSMVNSHTTCPGAWAMSMRQASQFGKP